MSCALGQTNVKDNVAEWSKAPASGAGPKGRGFKSHHYHFFFKNKYYDNKRLSDCCFLNKGDIDGDVDWEDFVLIQDQITTSFNERKLRSNFYLTRTKRQASNDVAKQKLQNDYSIQSLKLVKQLNSVTPAASNDAKQNRQFFPITYQPTLQLITPSNQTSSVFPNDLSQYHSNQKACEDIDDETTNYQSNPIPQSSGDQQGRHPRLNWAWRSSNPKSTFGNKRDSNSNNDSNPFSKSVNNKRADNNRILIIDETIKVKNNSNNLSNNSQVSQQKKSGQKVQNLDIQNDNNRSSIGNKLAAPTAQDVSLILNECPLDLYTTPEIDGLDPKILSENKLIAPFSFMNEKVFLDNRIGNAPTPTYLTYETLKPVFSGKKEDIMEGLLIQPKNGLKCVNERILEKQKGVVKSVISQAASNVFSGQSIIGISLPVRIFEPRSLLERICDWYGFAPIFLKKAAQEQDHLERFKLSISYALSSLYCSLKQQKPFNPLLGETYQASFTDNTRVYCEHTSHHPPISNYLIEDSSELYQVSGYYEFKAKISGNNLIMRNEGPNNIRFSDGQTITYEYPVTKLGGMLWGDRVLNIEGHMVFEDKQNELKAVVIFHHHRYDKFIGQIYHKDVNVKPSKKDPSKLSDLKDVAKVICEINGSIFENLTIGGQEYWNIDTMEPMKALPIPNALPSDPRYREDLIWLKRDNENYSQIWKTRLEIQQRYERKLRQDANQQKESKSKNKKK
eukprot:403339035